MHRLDDADRTCTSCGGALEEWQGQTEDSEEIDVLARTFVLLKHKRQKYRCACGGCVETASGPEKLFPGARYSIDFAVDVAISKYLDHMPLERQVRSMKRDGLEVESQTLWDYLERLAGLLQPAHDALHAHVLAQPVVGADETRWLLMGAPPGEKSRWQAWALATAHAVVYRILDSRSAEAAREVLRDYRGTVMADGYGAYSSLQKTGGGYRLAHCWAHVRRKYLECEETFPQVSEVLELIAGPLRHRGPCPTGPPGDQIRASPELESRQLVQHIHAWAVEQRGSREARSDGHRLHARPMEGPVLFSTTPPSRSTTTEPSAGCAAWWSGARTTTARSPGAAPRWRRSSTASSRAPS